MTTVSKKFHELGNWHNKLSMALIVVGGALEKININTMSKDEVSKILKKTIKDIHDCEGYIDGADKASVMLKDFIYKEIGKDSEILEP